MPEFSRIELIVLNNVLNEVCNGFYIDRFETKIGASQQNANLLLEKISTFLDRENAKTNAIPSLFSQNELLILKNSLTEVCKLVDTNEFEIRIGTSPEIATQILKKIPDTLNPSPLKP